MRPPRASAGAWPCWHLGLGHLASRMVKINSRCFKTPAGRDLSRWPRGERRRADAAGWDVRRVVGRAVILGVLALREAGVGRIVLERETHKAVSGEDCQADGGEGPPGLGLLN